MFKGKAELTDPEAGKIVATFTEDGGKMKVVLKRASGTPVMTLTDQIASKAELVVNTPTQTDYQHTDNIDTTTGVYDCDCNGFVGLILSSEAPKHFGLIQPEPGQSRPRAFVYYDFFAALTPESTGG